MKHEIHELNCITCRTNLVVRSNINHDYYQYKLVQCPNCNTPIREIRADMGFSIERITMPNKGI